MGRRGGSDGSGPHGDVFKYSVTLQRAVIQNALETREKDLLHERRRREELEKERDAERAKREATERQRKLEAERTERERDYMRAEVDIYYMRRCTLTYPCPARAYLHPRLQPHPRQHSVSYTSKRMDTLQDFVLGM